MPEYFNSFCEFIKFLEKRLNHFASAKLYLFGIVMNFLNYNIIISHYVRAAYKRTYIPRI